MKEYLLKIFDTQDLELAVGAMSLRVVFFASIILLVLIIAAVLLRDRTPHLKKPLFLSIALVTVLSSFLLIGSTVYVNTISESGGPVHWHADFEYWACDNELELRDPKGFLSNKIGTSTLHEHDDRRIHLEGVVVENRDASLGKFQEVIGGHVTNSSLVVPLNASDNSSTYSGDGGNTFENDIDGDGESDRNPELVTPYIQTTANGRVASFVDGQTCGETPAEVQVFVYQFDEDTDTYWQRKLENPAEYIITDESVVPPGDCVIFEFAATKDKTDKLCAQYGVRDVERCEEFGVASEEKDICEIREVENPNDQPAEPKEPENNSTETETEPDSQSPDQAADDNEEAEE